MIKMRIVLLIQSAFPLDNSITNIYTIPILQQGGGEYGRTKGAQTMARNDLSRTRQRRID